MVFDLAIAVVGAAAGSLGTLWLMLLCFGESHATPIAPFAEGPAIGDAGPAEVGGAEELFIPMPGHLKSRDEMVAWMVDELPRLTAERPRSDV